MPQRLTPAIVIQAYNRPDALTRLLRSLERAAYPDDVSIPLVISIDRSPGGGDRGVVKVAEGFSWGHGPKEVIHHPEHLGMVQHIFFCGGLAEKYGAAIFLEDDLAVSPVFYHYAARALPFYQDDPRIGGVSLYTLWFNGYTHHPFVPLSDDSDVFFLQIPYTQGQAWTAGQWQRFVNWRQQNAPRLRPAPGDPMHEMWFHFDAEDQFPIMTKYLVETGQFYVFPRASHATGFGDAGVHFARPSMYFQVPLQRDKTDHCLKPLAESTAVYDSFFEILPDRLNRLTGALREYNYCIDLNATKAATQLTSEYVLTARPARNVHLSFGLEMWPMEANVIEGVPGKEVVLARMEDLRWDGWSSLAARKRLHDYFTRRHALSRRLRLVFALYEWAERIRARFARR